MWESIEWFNSFISIIDAIQNNLFTNITIITEGRLLHNFSKLIIYTVQLPYMNENSKVTKIITQKSTGMCYMCGAMLKVFLIF
jgi:hypothetical protein